LDALDRKMLINFMAIWNIYTHLLYFIDHLVHFVFIWHIISGFGIMYQEKSGNPGEQTGRIFVDLAVLLLGAAFL
jgi:hypothetical protein